VSIIIEPQKQPDLMRRARLLSLAQALHMEVKFGMQLARGIRGLTIARQSYGFTGNRKPAALHYVIGLMRDEGMNIPDTLTTWEAENPA
jgi:hypothetical protein